jgi:hypothetical protein
MITLILFISSKDMISGKKEDRKHFSIIQNLSKIMKFMNNIKADSQTQLADCMMVNIECKT